MTAKLLTLLVTSIFFYFSFGDPIVELPNGQILGRESETLTGNPYYSFQKIPYATPPIYNLRFKAPVPPINWDGILDTSKDLDVICHQFYTDAAEASEDCLYLNVFTPQLPNDDDVALPVMFFIYGGAFINGDSRPSLYGPEYLIDDGVVVVTSNYRLGPLGFLSTGDEVIPGNNGLKDQLLALQWTHDNIALFGGDPDKITIFGQSAGAISVAHHVINTKSEGLFAGAIMESGTALMPLALVFNPKKNAFAMAGFLNATFKNSDDSAALFQFLQGLTAEEIEQIAVSFSQTETIENRENYQGYFWSAVIEPEIEGAVVTHRMYTQLKAGDIVKVPCLMGLNSEEDLREFVDNDAYFKYVTQTYDKNLALLVPDDMMVEDDAQKLDIGTRIREIYTGGEPLADNFGDAIRLFSDNFFTRGIIKQAELQSNFADVYFYEFSYDGALGDFNVHYDGADNVAHSEDLNYIWNYGDNPPVSDFPESDQITQRRIQKIWSDFAKFQNPTPEPSDLLQNITWPKVTADEFLYVDINDDLEIKSHPKAETYGKWVELYDSLGYDDFYTY